jgi:hypothetical protein
MFMWGTPFVALSKPQNTSNLLPSRWVKTLVPFDGFITIFTVITAIARLH